MALPKKLTFFLPALVRFVLSFALETEDLFFFFCLSRPIVAVYGEEGQMVSRMSSGGLSQPAKSSGSLAGDGLFPVQLAKALIDKDIPTTPGSV